MDESQRLKAFESTIAEPFGMEYREEALKTRRNLLIAGGFCVLVWSSNLTISSGSPSGSITPFFGITVAGLTNEVALWCLLVSTLYLVLHFLWLSADAISEYRLRRTGARLRIPVDSVFGNDGIEPDVEPRQSTLYSWWIVQGSRFKHRSEAYEECGERLKGCMQDIQSLRTESPESVQPHVQKVLTQLATARSELQQLKQQMDRVLHAVTNPRIETSLHKFDTAFNRHALSQNARWLVLEFGFPLVLGVVGCIMIASRLFPLAFAK